MQPHHLVVRSTWSASLAHVHGARHNKAFQRVTRVPCHRRPRKLCWPAQHQTRQPGMPRPFGLSADSNAQDEDHELQRRTTLCKPALGTVLLRSKDGPVRLLVEPAVEASLMSDLGDTGCGPLLLRGEHCLSSSNRPSRESILVFETRCMRLPLTSPVGPPQLSPNWLRHSARPFRHSSVCQTTVSAVDQAPRNLWPVAATLPPP